MKLINGVNNLQKYIWNQIDNIIYYGEYHDMEDNSEGYYKDKIKNEKNIILKKPYTSNISKDNKIVFTDVSNKVYIFDLKLEKKYNITYYSFTFKDVIKTKKKKLRILNKEKINRNMNRNNKFFNYTYEKNNISYRFQWFFR